MTQQAIIPPPHPHCSVLKGMRGQWSIDYGKQQMSPPRPPLLTARDLHFNSGKGLALSSAVENTPNRAYPRFSQTLSVVSVFREIVITPYVRRIEPATSTLVVFEVCHLTTGMVYEYVRKNAFARLLLVQISYYCGSSSADANVVCSLGIQVHHAPARTPHLDGKYCKTAASPS